MSQGEFSVYQFFPDEHYERVKYLVDAETAVRCAGGLTRSIGARYGMMQRVIITDGEDCICFEWKQGEGITDLTKEQLTT